MSLNTANYSGFFFFPWDCSRFKLRECYLKCRNMKIDRYIKSLFDNQKLRITALLKDQQKHITKPCDSQIVRMEININIILKTIFPICISLKTCFL